MKAWRYLIISFGLCLSSGLLADLTSLHVTSALLGVAGLFWTGIAWIFTRP